MLTELRPFYFKASYPERIADAVTIDGAMKEYGKFEKPLNDKLPASMQGYEAVKAEN